MSPDGQLFNIVQIVGAVMVLICFLLAQVNRVNTAGYPYLVTNLVGSFAMTLTAVIAHEWGFVFLEGIWGLVSMWGLAQRLRGISPQVAH